MTRLNGTLRLLAAMGTCVLASCGGGGGSSGNGGSGGGSSPTVTASAASFEVVGIMPYPSFSNTVIFTLTGGSATSYYAEAVSNLSGLTATLVLNGDGTASVSLGDSADGSTPGTRTGTVTFKLCTDSACNNVAWTNAYPVRYGRFQIDSSPLTLVGHEGADTAFSLTVTPPDAGHMLSVSSFVNMPSTWLAGTHDTAGNLSLTASAASLSTGNYVGYLYIGPDIAPGALTIPVSFNVGAGLTMPALADVVERVDTTAASLQGSGQIAFAGHGAAWSATSDTPWLVIDTPSGSGAGTLAYHVDAAAADAAVGNWSSGSATITVKAAGLSDATSVLTYRRQLPEVVTVTPSQAWPGQATTVRVTGRGLSQLTRIGQIQVGGQAATAGTLDSDTRATLQLGALAAGSLQISVPNALQVNGAQANLAVAAGRLPYAALATTGAKNAIVYDPSRQALFASDFDASALLRWKSSGGAWALTAVPWAGIWRVQLSPDRLTLYVLAQSGTLSELDPDTLVVRATHAGWSWSGFDFDEALPVTNDLRMWMPESGTQYFDLRTHAFAFAPASEFTDVGLTTMAATPDGAYLYSVDGSASLPPPDGWYSAATQTNAPLPSSVLQRAYRVSFDLDGGLGLFDWESVYHTGSWTLAGSATLPTSESGVGGVISPDGTRVYRLSGPASNAYNVDRVDVFDATQLQAGTSQFVLMGTIPIADRAVNCSDPSCDVVGRLVIDPLGTNLFWVGNQKFVVIPIPPSMAGASAATARAQRLRPSAAMTTTRR